MPRSHVEIAGEVGTRGLWPAALSSTSLAVAAASTRASEPRLAPLDGDVHDAVALTKPRRSRRGPHCLRLQVGLEALVTVLATDARGLEPAEGRGGLDEPPSVDVDRARA